MTVNTIKITSGPYIGNGIADTFSYTFRVADKSQLLVYETDDNGVVTLLTVDTDYTVAGVGVDQGGTITRVAGPLPTDYEWYIRSNYQKTQLTAFQSQGAFFPDIHEEAMDQLTFLVQQVCDNIDRSPRLSDFYSGTLPLTLDDPVAGKLLRWKGDLSGLEPIDVAQLSPDLIAADSVPFTFDNVPAAVASVDTNLVFDGSVLIIGGRNTKNDNGEAIWDVVLTSTVTPNTFNIVQCTGIPTLSLVLRAGQNKIEQWGAVSGQDSVTHVQAILDAGLNPIAGTGTFLFSAPLTMTTDGQRIIGGGISHTVFKSSGLTSTQAIIESENHSDIDFSGIQFDCNAECYMGVRFTLDNPGQNHKNITVRWCKVLNTLDTINVFFGGITVDNKQGAAATHRYQDVKIYRNILDTDTASHSCHGCIVAYANDVKFQNNTVESGGFHGMEAVGCHGVVITGNTANNCFESGLGVGSNTKDFIIAINKIDNCDGDGAITVEQNSVQGLVILNTLTECTNNGINVSFGTAGAAPFNEVNNVFVTNNLVMAASSGEGRIGINAYSSTGGAIGTGLHIKDNTFDGFATGVECTWLDFPQVSGNTIRRFGAVSVPRPDKVLSNIVGCDKFDLSKNMCEQDPTSHAIVIDTSLVANSRGTVEGGVIQSATLGALVRKIGNGDITVADVKTFGAVNFVSCDGSQQVTLGDNVGPLTGTPLTGGVLVNRIDGLTVTPEGNIPALIGAIAQRTNGGAGTTFYVKESNNGGSTGWVGK